MINAALLFLFASVSFASPTQTLTLSEVGKFGGFRVLLTCDFAPGECFVDTAGGTSITRFVVPGSQLLENQSISGIGWQTSCERHLLAKFSFAGEKVKNFSYLLCPDFSDEFSPMVGTHLFWGRVSRWAFKKKEFQWLENQGDEGFPLNRAGSGGDWIGLQVSLGDQTFEAAWDTGAPITLVDQSVVRQSPDIFEAVNDIPLPSNLAKSGAAAYLLKAPIKVAGMELAAGYVHAVDLQKFFGAGLGKIKIILGTNHLTQADWELDLRNLRGRISK